MSKVSGEVIMMRGLIATQFTAEQQEQVKVAEQEIRAVVEKHGPMGMFAIAIVGAEMGAEQEG